MSSLQEPYSFLGDWDDRLVVSAIHAGHDLRPSVLDHLVLVEMIGCAKRTRSPS